LGERKIFEFKKRRREGREAFEIEESAPARD
jgi:hypothetical protein